MSDRSYCSAMVLRCEQRAKADPQNSVKWLSRAERWRQLARAENSRRGPQQVMHAGPMNMQPNASRNPARQQQS
jgi:hypothetical protein